MIVDKPQKAVLLLEHVERKETPGLKLIILMDPFEEALKERGQKCGVVIKSMQAVEVRVCFWAVCWATLAGHQVRTSGYLSLSCPGVAVLGPQGISVSRQGRLCKGWWWVVGLVPTGILWEIGSVAGSVNPASH